MVPDVILESPSGSNTQEDPYHLDSRSDDLAVLTHRVNLLAEGFNKLVNGPIGHTIITAILTEILEKLSSLEDRFQASQGPRTHPHTPIGVSSPFQLQHSHFLWIDNTTLQNVIDGTLNPTHLIKLVPLKSHSKGQSSSSIAGINFDLESGKPTLTTDSNVTFEKHFPKIKVYTLALMIFGIICDLYDVDHLGFAHVVLFFIQQLTEWSRLGIPWSAILHYGIAHFRKHQTSKSLEP